MGKKLVCLILAVALTLSVLPVSAEPLSKEMALCQAITEDYAAAISDSGRSSLAGYCGLLASYQLYYRGINSWLQTANGNDHYDIYTATEMTSGGYSHREYSSVSFSMEEALSFACRGGTQDVYNALVCFQYTNTAAGQKYGHVVFIYGILDGLVYFTEGFDLDRENTAGQPMILTVSEFVNYYKGWTGFEGLVVFGKRDYIDNCTGYSTNLFVEVTEEAELTSEPSRIHSTEVDCMQLRHVMPGERLHATGLYKNTLGTYYYRIADGTQTGYIPAQSVNVLRVNFEDVVLSEAKAPRILAIGEEFDLSGQVSAQYSGLQTVRVELYGEDGSLLQQYSQAAEAAACLLDTEAMQQKLAFSGLKQGYYRLAVYADSANHYLMDDVTVFRYMDNRCLLEEEFCVGAVPAREVTEEVAQTRVLQDGWSYEDEHWYYYEDGKPRTGWFYHNGVDYYLQEDGSVTTGWAQINGKLRYFTATGAMRTGWLITKEGPVYLLSNGALAQGWIRMDGQVCWFNKNGTQGKGWVTIEDKQYYLDGAGRPVVGWITLEEGTFCFHEDGSLIAQRIEQDGKVQEIPIRIFQLPEE